MEQTTLPTPYVGVNITSSSDVLINICQIRYDGSLMNEGVTLALPQFKSLMFQLKAIDKTLKDNNFVQDVEIGNVNVTEFDEGPHTAVVPEHVEQITDQTLDMGVVCDEKATSRHPQTIREELVIVYAELIRERLPKIIENNICMGCAFDTPIHSCTNKNLGWFELYFNSIMDSLDEVVIRERLDIRMRNNPMPYNGRRMYVKKNTLLKNSKWIDLLKEHIKNM